MMMEKKQQEDEGNNKMRMRKPRSIIEHGLISVIGRRRSMEDAFTVYPDLTTLSLPHQHETPPSYDFFAVFDGHGNRKVSNLCKERLHCLVAEELTRHPGPVADWHTLMANSFARMDAEVAATMSSAATMHKVVGPTPTALVVVLVGTADIVVASFGDCRVVLFRDDAAFQLSRSRKALERSNEEESMEEAVGGVVNVSDLLSHDDAPPTPTLSIEAEAAVEVCKRNNALDDFIVIGTNGLWDVIGNDMAGDMVRKCFRGQVSKTVLEGVGGNCAAAAATMLAELAIARGSRDNISVIVLQLRTFDANSSSFTNK